MSSEMAAWLRDAMQRVEDEAQRAADGAGSPAWMVGERADCDCCDALRTDKGGLLCTADDRYSTHIALHDPQAVLRRVAADRKTLDLHAAIPDHGRFSEDSCPAYCDGVHDREPVCRACRNYAGDHEEAPCATVRLLAEGYGWTGKEQT